MTWDLASLSPLRTLSGHSLAVLQLLACGDHLVSLDKAGSLLYFWDALQASEGSEKKELVGMLLLLFDSLVRLNTHQLINLPNLLFVVVETHLIGQICLISDYFGQMCLIFYDFCLKSDHFSPMTLNINIFYHAVM